MEMRPQPRDRATRPREDTFRHPLLTEIGCGVRAFAGDTKPKGCCVGRAWRRREAAGSPVALERADISHTYSFYDPKRRHHHFHYVADKKYR